MTFARDDAGLPAKTYRFGPLSSISLDVDGSFAGRYDSLVIEIETQAPQAVIVAARTGTFEHRAATAWHWLKRRSENPLRPAMSIRIGAQGRLATASRGTTLTGRPVSVSRHLRTVAELAVTEEAVQPALKTGLLFSFVVPVFNTPTAYLDDLLASFRFQEKGLCELVLSDDGSSRVDTCRYLDGLSGTDGVTIVRGETRRGIAATTNAGIAAARGQWIGLLDHDDALAPFSVVRIARAIAATPGCRFVYTDEVVANRRLKPIDYFFKPAWDPVLLSGVNYINHLSFYRRDELLALGGLREGFQGSQDYDLLLRYTARLEEAEIVHLPYPAYLWRRSGSTYSARFMQEATANARKALAESYGPGRVLFVEGALNPNLHRLRFDLARRHWPRVSIVIPSRDAFALIAKLFEGLRDATDYPSLEIIVIDNGSTDPRTLQLYREAAEGPVPFVAVIEPETFNFSRAANKGFARAAGDYILLCNNDIEITEPGWLKEMVSCFDYPGTGIVGAKLLFPNGKIQHAGVIAGLGGLAGHWYINADGDFPGPMGRLWVRQSMTTVTGACMLVSRACWERTGPFDETDFAIAYNDIDFCLRATAHGFRVVWTPFASLVHHESATRGSDETPANIERFQREKANLRRHHATGTMEDRALNPWYSKDRSHPVPIVPTALPAPR